VIDKIVDVILEYINKKHKSKNLKPFQIKNHLWIFINAQIENPVFDSQTKDTLTLKPSLFGSKCEISDLFFKKLINCGVIDSILSWAISKQSKDIRKMDGSKRQRLVGIPKLDDANDAGGNNSQDCTLILTEGDSAKTLAVSGLSVVGRDNYGIFPIRGKLLNVRDASHHQIMSNAEINNLKRILGLQHGKLYYDTKTLRYGHLMIMTDQDQDGSHIKGLIMNYLHAQFPSLVRITGFLLEFITPIVKASCDNKTIIFYTMPEYETWVEAFKPNTAVWSIKYYKGLGTSTAKEAKEYFTDLIKHVKRFIWLDAMDDDALELAFSKKKVEERKKWLQDFVPGTYLSHKEREITFSDFVHRELILFSRADLERSIPSVIDGLKSGQRKILFACFKRNLTTDIKVAQLAGYVAEHSAYHHGEASLASTIINLAQDFVGSNNLNLLMPSGQFGTRLQGGKDAASPRYIFTRLSSITRHIFNEADDCLLFYLNEEGQMIEPLNYVPILPTILVNGAEGIGTGWSTFIPKFNLRDIIENIRRMLKGLDPIEMYPFYRGFKGTIEKIERKKYHSNGKIYYLEGIVNQINDSTLEVTELPIGKWTQDYKEYLEDLIKPVNKNEKASIQDYKEYHTDASVQFVLFLTPEQMEDAIEVGLHKKFRLNSTISTSNMILFGANGKIKKYEFPEDILKEFFTFRLDFYEKRRLTLLEAGEANMKILRNKMRFILAVTESKIKLSKRNKNEIENDLNKMGFDRQKKQVGNDVSSCKSNL
jgi:DNA topoisomerase-2